MRLRRFVLVLAGISIAPLAFGTARAETSFSAGIGARVAPDYAGSDEYDFLALPVINFVWTPELAEQTYIEDRQFEAGLLSFQISSFEGLEAEFARYISGDYALTMAAGLGVAGRDQDDNDALEGLGDIDTHVTGELSFRYAPVSPRESLFFSSELEFSGDLSGETDGQEISFEVLANHMVSRSLVISHGPKVVWTDDDYAQEWFGITDAQAASSVYAAYAPDGGINQAGYEINARYRVMDKISFITIGAYDRLLGDAADSPLVDDAGSPDQFQLISGLSYSF